MTKSKAFFLVLFAGVVFANAEGPIPFEKQCLFMQLGGEGLFLSVNHGIESDKWAFRYGFSHAIVGVGFPVGVKRLLGKGRDFEVGISITPVWTCYKKYWSDMELPYWRAIDQDREVIIVPSGCFGFRSRLSFEGWFYRVAFTPAYRHRLIATGGVAIGRAF